MADSNDHIPLDPAQHAAASAPVGPVLVEGGPGTGKGVALHARAAFLLKAGVSPRSIIHLNLNLRGALAVRSTFPEQLGRIAEGVSREVAASVRITTIQLLADSWLRRFGPEKAGIRNDFTVWDRRRSEEVVRELVKRGAYRLRIFDEDVPDILRWHRLRCSRMQEMDIQGVPALWPEIIQLYDEEKLRQNALDGEDLLLHAIRLMQSSRDGLTARREGIGPHLLVDGFQNLTQAEYRLLQLIAGLNGSITAAADGNQRVGSWRGADGGALEHFSNNHPGCQHFHLLTDHRFTPALHAFAAGLSRGPGMTRLARRVGHAEPDPGPSSGEGPILCEYHGSQDGLDHYTAIRIHGARVLGFQWRDIAVLCRRHSSIDRVVRVLTIHGIPHTVQGEDRGPVPREDGNGITVSTFHASQGRQWPFVWVADVSDRMVPGPTGLGDRFWVEEEKRLFYVAATRATKRLYFSYCSAGKATATRFFALVRDVMSTEVVEQM